MRFFVARHGESIYNKAGRIQGHTDIPLSETGKAQAEEAARKLGQEIKPGSLRGLYSSDLSRAYQTAEPFLKRMTERGENIQLTKLPQLREINLGEWEGKTKDELRRKMDEDGISLFEKWLSRPKDIIPPGAESMPEFYDRILRCFFEIAQKHKDDKGDIVIFTHGGVVSMMLNHIHGKNPGNFIGFSIRNTEIQILDFQNGIFSKIGEI